MASLQEIKKAKEFGKKLRIAREAQGHNLAILASHCGMSVVQLVALEAGNYFAFHNSEKEMNDSAMHYAQTLSLDINESNNSKQICMIHRDSIEPYIPRFLRKRECIA
jgi:transcriptional regulator with XRE-family HTH domain